MTRLARASAVLAAAALALAGAAAAGISATVSPATVTIPTVTLNGLDQQPTFDATVSITGAGNGGWNLTAWAPPPAGPSGSLGPVVVPVAPTGAGTPDGIAWPVVLGATPATATKIADALPGTANGSGTLDVTFGWSVPANALVGSYATTIDVAVASGP